MGIRTPDRLLVGRANHCTAPRLIGRNKYAHLEINLTYRGERYVIYNDSDWRQSVGV